MTTQLPDDETLSREWQSLYDEWQAKHEAALRFPLFEGGWMVNGRRNEWERLRAAKHDVRDRMDAFIARYRAGGVQSRGLAFSVVIVGGGVLTHNLATHKIAPWNT
jgi:hypothetical protein